MMPPVARQLILESLVLPRNAARRILSLAPPPAASLYTGLLAIILSTLFGTALSLLLPAGGNPFAESLLDAPLMMVAIQSAMFLTMVTMATVFGRLAGGHGDWAGALALFAWIQVMLVLLQVGQVAALMVLPALGNIVAIAVIFWFFHALSVFVAELHGFRNVLKVLGGIFISSFAVLLVLAFIVTLAGVPLPEMR